MQIADLPGAVVASAGTLEGFRSHAAQGRARTLEERRRRNATYDAQNVRHPFTGLHIIGKCLDYLEQYIAEARVQVPGRVRISKQSLCQLIAPRQKPVLGRHAGCCPEGPCRTTAGEAEVQPAPAGILA